jgi:superfamily II DNA helicase RecQ
MLDETMPRHGFLFGDNKGPWTTEQLTNALTRETGTRLGFRMTVQEYRHIATAIDRKFIRGKDAEPDDDDEEDGDDDVHDLMAAHSSKLANARYARMGGLTRSLTSESISIFRTISDKWQMWYKLEIRRKRSVEVKSEMEMIGAENGPTGYITSALRKIYGQGGKFKTQHQEDAVMSVATGINQLFVILPTGEGKSLTFILPTMTPAAKTTIVVTPLVALAEDMLRRCKTAEIDAIIYGRGRPRMSTIVIIVTESAVTSTSMQFIVDIFLAKRLDRIVFDECHKLITDVNFRPKLAGIKDICVGTQLIFLTATFPPTMLGRFQEHLVIKDPLFIRLPNNKLRTRYEIKILETEKFKRQAADEMQCALLLCEDTDKVLVFCRSRGECETWARRWECNYYHSQTENKSEVLEMWTFGLLFATGSLGAGVDIMNIKTIIHVGEPYGMVDYDQEVGRGGRSGEIVQAVTLLSERDMAGLTERRTETLSYDHRAMTEFLTTGKCRRTGMSKYLNGEDYEDNCESLQAELCDNCKSDLGSTALGKRRMLEEEETSRRVRQRRNYEERQDHLRQATITKERYIQHVLDVTEHLQGRCCICWLLDGSHEDNHNGKNCEELRQELGMTYREFKSWNMRYEDYSCCFRCGLPQSLCGAEKSQGCTRMDVIFPTVIMAWLQREELDLVEILEDVGDGRNFEDVMEYAKWIMKTEMYYGYKGTNAFKVFERVVRDMDLEG